MFHILHSIVQHTTIREGDTPAAMNARLGYNSSVIQIAQSIPLQPYDWVTGQFILPSPSRVLSIVALLSDTRGFHRQF